MTEQREKAAAEPPLDCRVGVDIECYRVNYRLHDWEALARQHGELCAPVGAVRAVNALCDEIERLTKKLALLHCVNGMLRADAERYSWLRSRVFANDPNIFSLPTIVSGANLMRGSVAQHFDDAIDSKRNAPNK